jgi:hypothetical protein
MKTRHSVISLKKCLISSVLAIQFMAIFCVDSTRSFSKWAGGFCFERSPASPFYWWPKTLLNYSVQFEKPVDSADFSLIEKETGKTVPFQFSDSQKTPDGKLLLTVSLLSDLPSGGSKTFVLTQVKSNQPFPAPAETSEGGTILIRTNKLTIRIPSSLPASGDVPGPVIQLFQNQRIAMGRSVLVTGAKKVQRLETQKLASGPLFRATESAIFLRMVQPIKPPSNALRITILLNCGKKCPG